MRKNNKLKLKIKKKMINNINNVDKTLINYKFYNY